MGPDLTRSGLVAQDSRGDKIGPLVRAGRVNKGMPAFDLSDAEIEAMVAFIHDQKTKGEAVGGGRRSVDVSDLQTGNPEAGQKYFNGAGGCSRCHSATGDLPELLTVFVDCHCSSGCCIRKARGRLPRRGRSTLPCLQARP